MPADQRRGRSGAGSRAIAASRRLRTAIGGRNRVLLPLHRERLPRSLTDNAALLLREDGEHGGHRFLERSIGGV